MGISDDNSYFENCDNWPNSGDDFIMELEWRYNGKIEWRTAISCMSVMEWELLWFWLWC
jgi:hypothetical protein